MVTSYTDTDTNINSEPPHVTIVICYNNDGDINNDSYDHTAANNSSKLDTPPPTELQSYPNYQQAQSIFTKRIQTNQPGYQRITITNRSIETNINTVYNTPDASNQPETTPIPPPTTPSLHDVPPTSQQQHPSRGQMGVSTDMLTNIILRKTSNLH